MCCARFPHLGLSPQIASFGLGIALLLGLAGGIYPRPSRLSRAHHRSAEAGVAWRLPLRYNLRNLRARWKVTLLAIFGIALVVAAVVVIASMSAGFRIALRSTGSDNNAIVVQRGSLSELTSWIAIGNAQTILSDPRIARDAQGTPLASCEIVIIASKPKKSDNLPANITLRGVTPMAFKVRNDIKMVEGRMFEPGLFEVIVGKKISDRVKGLNVGDTIRVQHKD